MEEHTPKDFTVLVTLPRHDRPGRSGHWMDTVLCDPGEGTKRSLHIPMPHPRAAVTSEGSVILSLSFSASVKQVLGL